jgi:hypothetical protein
VILLAKLLVRITVDYLPIDPDTGKAVEITHLLGAFNHMLKGKEDENNTVNVYNSNTCIEFYCLLVTTISSYLSLLEAL